MPKLEVFFDYACPYCLTGHIYLIELLPAHPDIEVIWRPCESHPRPETHGLHSDLCIQGLLYFIDQGVDVWEYHERMYSAALIDRVNIEDPNVIAGRTHGLLDHDAFLKCINSGKYEKAVAEANDYAYERSGVWAVPSFRMDGRKLDSVEKVGVTKRQLADFLSGVEDDSPTGSMELKRSAVSGLNSIIIRPYRPGEASYVAYLQMKFYEQEYGFKGTFEHYILAAMAEFTASPDGSQIWVATDREKIIGSIAIVRTDEHTAQLRWFFTEKQYRGKGIGKRLMGTSVQFCKDRGYSLVFLWTLRGLDAAGHLYEKYGFKLTETKANTEWADEPLTEERWDLISKS